eukprot:CAMPEP_0170872858 /NCGR_PEP_ID=MMETSP0734-20130129/26945_1 /TAXON_ID=186038 /ORGANISM="Fragilariopsis kerguelensis, Strain L26-C5" /LENGTH=40 /DNA_ID= /DNA_START= /DNA_END= /DNA_ORIENTATION=
MNNESNSDDDVSGDNSGSDNNLQYLTNLYYKYDDDNNICI